MRNQSNVLVGKKLKYQESFKVPAGRKLLESTYKYGCYGFLITSHINRENH